MWRIGLEDNQGFGIAVDFSMSICIIFALFHDTIRKFHRTILSMQPVGRARSRQLHRRANILTPYFALEVGEVESDKSQEKQICFR